jgi:gamma-glutamylcyclotransferase (GGCT)/AIG2-like uncharacterized protein YtfP
MAQRARRSRSSAVPRGERADRVHEGSLFAYGTLADARFVARLLERPVASEPAELLDFLRVEPVGFAYPVVLESPGERTAGVLYRHLGEEDFRRLDGYEGVGEGLYFRERARVARPGAAAPEPAWVYLPTERTVARFAR